MTQPDRNLERTFLFLALFLTALWAHGGGAQRPRSQAGPEQKFLEANVSEFEMHDQTVVEGLWELARVPAPFAFGFEHVLKKRFADPDIPDLRFNLRLRNMTVREILDALCQADSRYAWSTDGVTVNVFPRSVTSDSAYLLNRKFDRFELKNATDVQNGLLAIVHQLPPPVEQIAQAQAGGDDPYPAEPWTVTYYNLTVRKVANRLAAHGGPCGIWIFGGSEDFRAFGFFNTYLNWTKQPSPDPEASIQPTAKD